LTEQLPIPLFQLHQMIFRIGQDSPVYGPFYSILFYSIWYLLLFHWICFRLAIRLWSLWIGTKKIKS